MTDSLERELINRELDYYNDAPLLSLVKWVGAGLKTLQNKLVSYVAAVSTDLDDARRDGHKVTAA
ncbi:MAG TPA: hypothetical protein VL003_06820 [Pusillimonas sp.]|nr:hypothetical protein [Pusillimonas sp.]